MQLNLPNIEGSGELYLQIMKAICGDTSDKSMVDIGCHRSPYNSQLGFRYRTYVDILNRPLDDKDEQQFFIQEDAITFLQRGVHYDYAIAADFLEHLTLANGYKFIKLMQQYSDTQILFTPLGEWMVNKRAKHPDMHKSGWIDSDFENMGWATIVLPEFHPILNIGALFSFNCKNLKNEFERVREELKALSL